MSDMGAPFNGEGRPPGFLYPNGWNEEKVQAVVSDWALAIFIPPSSVVDDDQMVVGAAILGPLFSGIGLYLLNKEHATANWQDNSPSRMYGTLLTSFGVVLSVSSIPLFVSAGKTRREADLLLTAGYVTPFQSLVAAPGAGVRISF